MRNVIQLKAAAKVEVGDFVMSPQFSTGIILANKVTSIEVIDEGKYVEIATQTMNYEGKKKRLYVVLAEDKVAVVI